MERTPARVGVHVQETELRVLDLVACYCKEVERRMMENSMLENLENERLVY
jgi:hypothetical protein